MATWRPQQFIHQGMNLGIDFEILRSARNTGYAITKNHPDLPPIFSLRHLAHLSGVEYGFLRKLVERNFRDTEPYRTFKIRKRSVAGNHKRFRIICVPSPQLMRVQKWISRKVLRYSQPHFASAAFAKHSNIRETASLHCQCRWLIKLDVCNFFESITEISAYNAFRSLSYQPLIAFELARICTRLGSNTRLRRNKRWLIRNRGTRGIGAYDSHTHMGHLPQGAPTSPMLANLSMIDFDQEITELAEAKGLLYSRYADDLIVSTRNHDFSRNEVSQTIGKIYKVMASHGLSPNVTKTRVSPPGARKVVLGLVVNNHHPRLTREYKANLRRHLHYLTHKDIGPSAHAHARGFSSVIGLKNHVQGLVAHATEIEPGYGQACKSSLSKVAWPI